MSKQKIKIKNSKEKIIVKIIFFLIFLVSVSIVYKGYQKITYKNKIESSQTYHETKNMENLFLDKSFDEYKRQNKWYQNVYILIIVVVTIIILFFI